LVLEVVFLVVGLESLQEVSLLGVLPPRAQYGDGRICGFEFERRDGPRLSFRGFGPSPGRKGGFPHGVTVVVFVVVALVGKMVWIVLTPLLSK
jgi:hypothetical protein